MSSFLRLSHIPLRGRTMFCLSVHPSMGSGAASIHPKILDLITSARSPFPVTKHGNRFWELGCGHRWGHRSATTLSNHIGIPQVVGPFFLGLGVPVLSSRGPLQQS